MPLWASDYGEEGQNTMEGRWDKCFLVFLFSFVFFPPVFSVEKEAVPCCQPTSALNYGGLSFDDALETPMWERVLQEYYLSDFDSPETLLVWLLQG